MDGEYGISLNDKDKNLGKFIESKLVRFGELIGIKFHKKFFEVFLYA
jgi:hypothetical protein